MKKYLVGLVLLASSSVFAASATEPKNTDMYAPKGGGHEFLVGILLPTGKNEAGGVSTTYSGLRLNLEYGYGFSDAAAIYVTQGYEGTKVENSPGSSQKTTGIGLTKVGVKAVIDFNQTFFYYDIGYQMALLEKPKQDSSGDNNGTSVGVRPVLEATGGVGASFDMFGLGAKLTFDSYQDGDFDANGITVKYKSGSGMAWKLYAQYQSSFKLGLSYGEMTVDSYDTTVGGVATSQVKDESKVIALYSIIPVSPASEIFVEVQKPEKKSPAVSTTYSQYNIAAAYRMTF